MKRLTGRLTIVDAADTGSTVDILPPAVVAIHARIKGNIRGCVDLTVEGHVEGSVRISATLHVEQGGEVAADVETKAAIVSGRVRGSIHATESVRITPTGRVIGDISAPRVIVEEGAAFRGRIDTDGSSAEEPGWNERTRAAS